MSLKVSICCITYNHGEYIGKAIESFLGQKGDFSFEIIISDDNSTDNTLAIVNAYRELHPDIIKVHVNNPNLGPMKNFIKVFGYAKGDYIAYSDGDDFWTDPGKLAKQIEVLENNQAVSFVFHDVSLVDKNGESLWLLSKGRLTESLESGIISSNKVLGSPLKLFHANALFFRRQSLGDMKFLELFEDSPTPDYTLLCLVANQGDGYYINSAMSAYRKHGESVSSAWQFDKNLFTSLKEFYNRLDDYFLGQYHSEFSSAYKGHVIVGIEHGMNKNAREKKLFKFLTSAFKLLWYHNGSQYTFRDVVWLIKEDFKKIIRK